MTTPCERKDDITEIKEDVKELKKAFHDFRLTASIDLTNLKAESKAKARNHGGLWGAIVAIIIAVADSLLK